MEAGKLRPPAKEVIHNLMPYVGLGLSRIHIPVTDREHADVWGDLLNQTLIGFDTETKPTFVAGAEIRGPDVVQFATATRAYVLQMRNPASVELAQGVLAAHSILKVGFGIQQDQMLLRQTLGAFARPVLDVDLVFHQRGYGRSLGIKNAVALVFDRRLMKSKRVTTSNWAARELDARQVLYAGNDAYVALKVLQALEVDEASLPVWADGFPPEPPTDRARERARRCAAVGASFKR